MKLQELAMPSKTQMIAKTFESYFGAAIDVKRLNAVQTQGMLAKVQTLIREHQTSFARHTSEKNPAYLKLVMIEQALVSRMSEMAPTAGAVPATTQQQKPAVQGAIAKDPKLAAALKKSAAGQTLSADEQKLVAGAAMMQAENRLRRAYRMLKESQVQQAQITLAAQEMVDKMQSMIEDISELQFKELPALVESIKNDPQLGMDKATQFNSDATTALTGLLQNIQGAKQQMEAALGVVTGQGAPSAAGAEFGAELGADVAADTAAMDAAAGAESDMAAGTESDVDADLDAAAAAAAEPMGSATALGRQRR